MSITATNVNTLLDLEARKYACVIGSAAGYGIGEAGATYGAAKAASDLQTAVLAISDATVVNTLLQSAIANVSNMSAVKVSKNSALLNKIEKLCRDAAFSGVNSLDQFLTYYNYGGGGTNTALQNPHFRKLFYAWKGAYPTARNLYYLCKVGTVFEGNTHTNALAKYDVTGASTGTFTAGYTIPTDYAGGLPKIVVSGFAGASAVVTVTGTQYDPATGNRTGSKTWTATVTGDGTVDLASGGGAAASANALICAVSAVSVGAAMTNGDIYVEAHAPSGRLAIPF